MKVTLQTCMDANAKVGERIIKGDPHHTSSNGKIMLDIMERQNMIIANSLDICRGTITRERVFEKKAEKSVIDYIVISEDLLTYLVEMTIDEARVDVLSRFVKTRNGNRTVKSDHNILRSRFSITFTRKKRSVRKEYFQFKNESSRAKFLEETNSTTKFSSCFE